MTKSKNPNIINVSWGDHLGNVNNNSLHTFAGLERRMAIWQSRFKADKIYWRLTGEWIKKKIHHGYGWRKEKRQRFHIDWRETVEWNQLLAVPLLAHNLGMKAYLYVFLFDEGWPLAAYKIRKYSYHNSATKHSSIQSMFSYRHPEYARIDRTGKKRQWGVLSLSYPEIRKHFQDQFLNMLNNTDFDGLFVCLRSQSQPAEFADQFGFNEPIRTEYYKRYKKDILNDDFDLWNWRNLEGEYLTIFIRELKERLDKRNIRLSIGVPTGYVIGPPMGNMTIDWRTWILEGLIDELIINQNATYCPSMLHRMWPMHEGWGYIQNYISGYNMRDLSSYIKEVYAIFFKDLPAQLYVSCQWDTVQPHKGSILPPMKEIDGLVFSSFQFDNPEYKAQEQYNERNCFKHINS